MEEIDWITTHEAARIIKVHVTMVQKLCKEYEDNQKHGLPGGLVSRRFGDQKRAPYQVSRASAEAYTRLPRKTGWPKGRKRKSDGSIAEPSPSSESN